MAQPIFPAGHFSELGRPPEPAPVFPLLQPPFQRVLELLRR
jgi:hypothetical protein